MKTPNVILILLLVLDSIAIAAEVKSPAVLLQEGIYAEETEGNLDKAMEIYGQIREKYNDVERIAAKATYQLGLCNLKKGDNKKAAELFDEVVGYYPQQTETVKMAQEQLDKLGVKKTAEGNLFEILERTSSYIGSKYGEISAEAGTKKLYSNCHIYLVDKDFVLRRGGMGYIYNLTNKPITKHYRISSTTYPTQKLYDIMGNPLDIEIVPDANRSGYYGIYWNPKEPVQPSGFFNYGWALDGNTQLASDSDANYSLRMQNKLGTHGHETFFLVVPEGTVIASKSEEFTNKGSNINGWDIYWWKKEVQETEHHIVNITLKKGAQYTQSAKPLKLEPAPWVDGEVMELRLKRPAGNEYGMIIYSAQKNQNNWQIISHTYISEDVSQYTFVEADANSFTPVYGQTTNWMGDFKAEYGKENVKLTVDAPNNKSTRDVPVASVAYDNEQAIYLIRRMPLAEGYEGSFSIFTVQSSTTVECRIKVLGIEQVTVEAGTFKCYKTDLSIYVEETKTLQHTLWFSADEHKYLVKYDVGGAATMEMAKTWQKDKDQPITFENTAPAFAATIPADWRYYKYNSAEKPSMQLIPPQVKARAAIVWKKRETDSDSASAITKAKAVCEERKGTLENYIAEPNSWKEFKFGSLDAAQYIADYQESGNGMQKYTNPRQMTEYRTYIVDKSYVYWLVFKIEKNKFEENRAEFNAIVNSFKINAN